MCVISEFILMYFFPVQILIIARWLVFIFMANGDHAQHGILLRYGKITPELRLSRAIFPFSQTHLDPSGTKSKRFRFQLNKNSGYGRIFNPYITIFGVDDNPDRQ